MDTQSNEMNFEGFEDLTAEELLLASGGCGRRQSRRYRDEEITLCEGLDGRSELSPETFSISTRTRARATVDGITVRVRISSPAGITRT